jgi:hypothetical protein
LCVANVAKEDPYSAFDTIPAAFDNRWVFKERFRPENQTAFEQGL